MRVVLAGILVIGLVTAQHERPSIEPTIMRAIRQGDGVLMRTLLQERSVVNVRTEDGTTPLMLAALVGTADDVALLLRHGADAKATSKSGATALLWGAPDVEKVRLLVEHGADVDAQSKAGITPLMAAAQHPEGGAAVELLLASGADPGLGRPSRDFPLGRFTPLVAASIAGNLRAVRALLPRDESKEARTLALLFASGRGHAKIVKLMLDAGGDVNFSDGSFMGHSLNWALIGGFPETARLVLAAGADPHLPTPVGGVPPVALTAFNDAGDDSMARALLERGADAGATSRAGETAVQWARRHGHEEMAALFARRGAAKKGTPLKAKVIPSRNVSLGGDADAEILKASIRSSLALLRRSSEAFLRNRNDCVSCHHQNLPAVAFGWARDRGFTFDAAGAREIIDVQMRSWAQGVERSYQMQEPMPAPSRSIGWGVLGLAALGQAPNRVTDAATFYLTRIQHSDGRWTGDIRRPPLGDDDIMSTALTIRSLQLYPPFDRTDLTKGPIAAARRWLENAKAPHHQQRVMKLMGLAWAGSSEDVLRPAARAVLSDQRDDGGWAQLPGLGSDAWGTGQALVALHLAGALTAEDPRYRRGLEFLLRTQFDDGSWFVRSRTYPFQPHFDSEYPHGKDQWISAAASSWATMAMLLAVEPFRRAEVAPPPAKVEGPSPSLPVAGGGTLVDFQKDIRPLLQRSCLACHGGDRPKGNFLVTKREHLIRGGESGAAAITPGKGARSLLYRVASDQIEDMEMPPLGKRDRHPALSKKELERLRMWIDQGATWPKGVELRKGGY